MRMLDFQDDLQCRGIYKSIVLKRETNIPLWPLNSGSGKLWIGNQTKPFHQAIFDLPLSRVLICVVQCVTLYAIFNRSMPCDSGCSHLINKVNRYLKLCEQYSTSVSYYELWSYREYKESKRPPPHKPFSFEFAANRQAGITVMLFDSKSY